jgi:oxygen-independent coproporphyrinogen-3 oxidase
VDLGLYMHFPWCRARCPYCDFAIAVAPLDEIPHQAWADAILAELERRAPAVAGLPLASIYLGGGTPALWQPVALGRALAGVREKFEVRPGGAGSSPDQAGAGRAAMEVTIEANPLDCRPPHLAALREVGVNRLSIGVQSLDQQELVQLGRDHDVAQARAAVAAARSAGFEAISLDCIYGLPGQTAERLARTLDGLLALDVPHLSAYQLTVEERTPLAAQVARGEVVPEPDERQAAAFMQVHEALTAAGYQHYEVSAYARLGAQAVHNARYWVCAPYLGLGNGAHSLLPDADGDGDGMIRLANHRSVRRYLEAPGEAERTVVSTDMLAADRIWLGLRTTRGVAVDAPGLDQAAVPALLAAGLLTLQDRRLVPTVAGLLVADSLGARLAQTL